MVKKIIESPYLKKNHYKLMQKIKYPGLCEKGEKVIKQWKFGQKDAHAGQIQGTKILPNGNKQVRITTAYAGDGSAISTDTRVFSPDGELLKAYHGLRGAEINITTPDGKLLKNIKPTRQYADTGSETAKAINIENKLNPEIKYMNIYPKQ